MSATAAAGAGPRQRWVGGRGAPRRPRGRRRSSSRRAAPAGSAGWSGTRTAMARARRPRGAARGRSGSARSRRWWRRPRRAARGPGLPASAWVTSRQSPGEPPRPTRPRSWWSWETPKRSASSSTIAVALATSTPTSITVVATSTSISPAAKARMVAVLLVRRQPAVQHRRPAGPASGPSVELVVELLDGGQRTPAAAASVAVLVVEVDAGRSRPPRLVAGDPRADDVDLVALGDLLADPLPDPVDPVRLLGERHDVGLDGAPGRRAAR